MLEDRIYRILLITGIALSTLNIIGNSIIDLPFRINIKWITLIVVGIAAFYSINYPLLKEKVKFLCFLLLILVFIPLGWFDSGGSANNTIPYGFFLLVSITYLFDGKKRSFLVFVLISTFTGLYILEYIRPELKLAYSAESQLMDRLVQIPLTLYVTYTLIKQFANAYNTEKYKQEKYSKELMEANEQLNKLATFDSLTNVNNRRIFDEHLHNLIEDENTLSNVFIALLDIDHFKTINDTHGHLIGDELLIEFSKKALEIIPKPHVLARWGGDEFGIIYFGNKDTMLETMNDLRLHIQKIGQKKNLDTTISIGVTNLRPSDSVKDLLRRADLALYETKTHGRDNITLSL
ncbi:GGDEF domain-containing protein [Vallitalea okinawensis]|uniref:GGDEF domain-containing protein n=1 Tax=Vallitalea okinawensis TaxID=2078660 RepID=UPI000CFBF535|nr:GGDEF domain-containing protein [Vallitalea okinawensis]